MGGRTHRSLIAAALLAVAPVAAAQNPPPAPPGDTLAPQQIFNDVFAPGGALPGYVVLSEGVVYRVEIQPNAASVRVRVRRHPTLPPLLMVPLAGEGTQSQTGIYLIVPRASDEYRLDVTAPGEEPVRVRIWSDPREMSSYARMRAATHGLPTAGIGLRVAYIGPFARLARPYPNADSGGNASVVGAELCLGVVPRGSWSYGRLGGCVLQVGYYARGPDGNVLLFSVAPRFEATGPRAPVEASVTGLLGLGTTLSVKNNHGDQTYLALGLGLDAATPLPGTARHLWLDAEASIVRIQAIEGSTPAGSASLVPRLASGVQFRF